MSRQEDFKRMAHSHDTESSKYEQEFYIDGAEDGYEYAVDRACEWLEKNMFEKCEFDEYGNITQTYACSDSCDFVSQFVEQFRKAMED